jgi:imidazoleglycerol-phosphate dehydratase
VLGAGAARRPRRRAGIRRYGFQATVPLDGGAGADRRRLSGRPFLAYGVELKHDKIGTFDVELIHDFLLALTRSGGHRTSTSDAAPGRNPHHVIEAIVQGTGPRTRRAVERDPRVRGVLSTKGVL